jgi:hypothetical protein
MSKEEGGFSPLLSSPILLRNLSPRSNAIVFNPAQNVRKQESNAHSSARVRSKGIVFRQKAFDSVRRSPAHQSQAHLSRLRPSSRRSNSITREVHHKADRRRWPPTRRNASQFWQIIRPFSSSATRFQHRCCFHWC